MKKFILATFCLLTTMMSFAQEIQKGTDKKGNLVLEKDGKTLVKESFEKAGSYIKEAGLIPAKLNGKWGFYDNEGKLIISHQFESLYCSSTLDDWYVQERILVRLDGKKVAIDKTGKIASPLDFEEFVKAAGLDNYYLIKDGKWALGDKDKKRLTEFVYQMIAPKSINPPTFTAVRDGKPYSLDANGDELGAAKTTSSSDNKSSESSKKLDKYKYVCEGCGAVEIVEGDSTRPSPNKTHCPSPATKNSTSHKWKLVGKVD